MAGVSTNRVARIAQDRGYSFVAIDSTVKTLRAAGADAGLIAVLQKGKPVEIASDTSCSHQLGPIAGLIQQKSYQQAQREVQKLVKVNSDTSTLQLAIGRLLAWQQKWYEGFDEFG